MRKLVILGAGQMGRAALLLVNTNFYEVVAYGDNHCTLHQTLCNIPVISIEEALLLNPDQVLIAVMGKEREQDLIGQIQSYHYEGEIHTLNELTRAIDIRKATLLRMKERIDTVSGAVGELGVYKGDFSKVLNELFPERKLYLFDTFEGFDDRDLKTEDTMKYSKSRKEEFADTSETMVKLRMPHPEQVQIVKGYFPETTAGIEDVFALVSLDADLYEPTLAGLRWFYKRMQSGGVIILHDYNNPRFGGAKKALEVFESEHGRISLIPLSDLHGSAIILIP